MWSVDGIERLFFYGCSFTAGAELFDDIELCRNHAWPATVCKELGIKLVNRASGGNGIDRMKSQFLRDVVDGEFQPSDGVVIGSTMIWREMHFHSVWPPHMEHKNDMNKGDSWSEDIAHRYFRVNKNSKFADKYSELKNTYYFIHNYWNALHDIFLISNEQNIPIWFVPSLEPISLDHTFSPITEKFYGKKYNPDIQFLKKHIDTYEFVENLRYIEKKLDKYIVDTTCLADPKINVNPMPRGHPNMEVHKMFGKHIAEILRN